MAAHGNDKVAQPKTLLSLPAELRLQILDYVLADLPLNPDGELEGEEFGWLPPPVLQTCHTLRREGLEGFMRERVYFGLIDYSPYQPSFAAHRDWMKTVTTYYSIPTRQRVEVSIWEPFDDDEGIASINLWTWLKDFYVNDQTAIFAKEDFHDDTMRGRHIQIMTSSEEAYGATEQ